MTRRTNARVAGVTFLAYIVVGVVQMVVGRGTSAGSSTEARLASLAEHAAQVRINVVLGVSTSMMALILAATLYELTREQSNGLALLALACRVGEGLWGAMPVLASLGLLWLATNHPSTNDAAIETVAALLWKMKAWLLPLGATFFAVGSTIFAALLLRARIIPAPLGWLGVIASLLLVLVLPIQLVGYVGSPLSDLVWLPMALYEIPLALWLLFKVPVQNGAATPLAQRIA